MATLKQMEQWSDAAKVAGYRKVTARLKELEEQKKSLTDMLLEIIPPGETIGGVQHSLVSIRKPDEDQLRRLGHWPDVVKESVDSKKLSALLKLRPEIEQVVLAEAVESHRLTVREQHK